MRLIGIVDTYGKSDHIGESAGEGDAGKPIVLASDGRVHASMLPAVGGLSVYDNVPIGKWFVPNAASCHPSPSSVVIPNSKLLATPPWRPSILAPRLRAFGWYATAGSALAVLHLGLYEVDITVPTPTTLVTAVTQPAPSNGRYGDDDVDIVLSPSKWYAFAYCVAGSLGDTQFRAFQNLYAIHGWRGYGGDWDDLWSSREWPALVINPWNAALPATFPAGAVWSEGTAGSIPAIGVKMAA